MAPTIQRVSRSTNALRNNPIVPSPPAAERVSTPGSSASASAAPAGSSAGSSAATTPTSSVFSNNGQQQQQNMARFFTSLTERTTSVVTAAVGAGLRATAFDIKYDELKSDLTDFREEVTQQFTALNALIQQQAAATAPSATTTTTNNVNNPPSTTTNTAAASTIAGVALPTLIKYDATKLSLVSEWIRTSILEQDMDGMTYSLGEKWQAPVNKVIAKNITDYVLERVSLEMSIPGGIEGQGVTWSGFISFKELRDKIKKKFNRLQERDRLTPEAERIIWRREKRKSRRVVKLGHRQAVFTRFGTELRHEFGDNCHSLIDHQQYMSDDESDDEEEGIPRRIVGPLLRIQKPSYRSERVVEFYKKLNEYDAIIRPLACHKERLNRQEGFLQDCSALVTNLLDLLPAWAKTTDSNSSTADI